ncbi:right-handed parallel beta-helix repeat-containing protein [Methylomonas sp. SURF-1]|uniref:Right-handed parallel beta-helix repeat-containing protein n=1 Tax=Methylomonas aurea TaxID=2952224 RepID=A0ABT1UKN1_9GAMM|nr:right-handed parallel beta-helix repeat-containing protein [Methylomonas sp. SURF-1]MCQ8182798.1 right-handed parallel beta-helix repeat-containing protein [Methylomonas sp. SURF-1]
MYFKMPILLACLFLCTSATARDFYVSPTGSDKLDGSSPNANFFNKTGPFKTLNRAKQAIRDLKLASMFNEPVVVHLGKGTYPLQAPLELGAEDSGLPGQEIIWEGESNSTIISGGIQLNNCQAYDELTPEKIISCPVTNSTISNITAEKSPRIAGDAPKFELFVNEHKMHLARWPNEDWAHIRIPLRTRTRLLVLEKMPQFQGDLSKAQIHIFAGNDIVDEYIGVAAFDLTNNHITLSSDTSYNISSGRRFYLENIKAELDTSEEWFYDKATSRIYLIPPKNTTPEKIVISYSTNLIKIRKSSHITFRNLTFRHSTGNAINIDQSNNISIDGLEINNIGGIGIRAPNNNNITISNSYIHDTGLGGILLSGGDRTLLESANNLIENNTITNYDTVLLNYSPAIAISGVGTSVTHNLIYNSTGNAIVVAGNEHLIEKNEVTQICKQAGDCGAIYLAGRDWTYRGNVVRYNYVHDFTGYQLNQATLDIQKNKVEYIPDGARGIYLDDGASGNTVYGNILDNISFISIHVGGGRDNRIENNVIRSPRYAFLMDNRGTYADWTPNRESLATMPISSEAWQQKYPQLNQPMNNDTWPEGNTVFRNIFAITSTNPTRSLRYVAPRNSTNIGNNLVWHRGSDIRVDYMVLETGDGKGGAPWTTWIDQGIELNSINADPCINIVGGVVKVTCSNSPINSIRFDPIPTDIGLLQ